jgi:nuclear pore complex protein Nup98-Nup96
MCLIAGGPNPASPQPAAGGIFGHQPTSATSSPFGAATSTFGSPNPNPFASKPTFGSPSTPAPAFGQPSTPAFGSSTFGSSTPAFGASAPAFGQASSTPAFGSSPSPFGQTSASSFSSTAFGASSSPSLFGQSTTAFGASSPAFGAASTPAFGAPTAPAFGGGSLFGSSQPASSGGGLFGASTPAFGASPAPAFGQSQAGFGSNLFGNTSSPGSIFGQTKPAGLTQSSVCNPFFTFWKDDFYSNFS